MTIGTKAAMATANLRHQTPDQLRQRVKETFPNLVLPEHTVTAVARYRSIGNIALYGTQDPHDPRRARKGIDADRAGQEDRRTGTIQSEVGAVR